MAAAGREVLALWRWPRWGIKCARMRWEYKRVCGLLRMPWLTQTDLDVVVQRAVKEVLGEGIVIPRFGDADYEFEGMTYDAWAYKVGSIRGLKIKGQDFADTIQMRGYIKTKYPPTQFDTYDSSQFPCIVICDVGGKALITLCKNTQQLLLNELRPLLTRENLPTSVPPSLPWAQLVDRVCEAAKEVNENGDGVVMVRKKELLDLARAMLELLHPRVGVLKVSE
jgi:hypothetical protein